MSVYRKHAHIFWIPLFPIGKKGLSQCQHCKQVLEVKQMPDTVRRDYEQLKHDTKGPLWQFAGLGIIAFLIVMGSFASVKNKKLAQDYLASPQKGDVYEFKTETGSYSTLKVMAISTDSVWVAPNEFEISKRSRIYKIDKPKNYLKITYSISKNKLKKQYDTGVIFDVNR